MFMKSILIFLFFFAFILTPTTGAPYPNSCTKRLAIYAASACNAECEPGFQDRVAEYCKVQPTEALVRQLCCPSQQ